MRLIVFITSIALLFLGCKPADCVKSTGPLTSKIVEVPIFEKIMVHNGIALVVSQGSEYKVEVRSGENLIDDIEVKVTDKTLTLQDNTTCNWVRDYGQTTVYVTAPNLTDIYSKTEKNIVSQGVISFPTLRLVAMDLQDGYEGSGTGDCIFEVDNENLILESNSLSKFTITGKTNNLKVNIYEGGSIMDTQNLIANQIQLYHRGSNTMFVHPVSSLKGDIYNIGNVISVTHPPLVAVVEHYKGKLIFR